MVLRFYQNGRLRRGQALIDMFRLPDFRLEYIHYSALDPAA